MWYDGGRRGGREERGGEEDEEDEVTVDFGGKFLARPINRSRGKSDMPMLSFYHNGTPISMYDVDKVRGTVRPAISVEQGASAEFIFDEVSSRLELDYGGTRDFRVVTHTQLFILCRTPM